MFDILYPPISKKMEMVNYTEHSHPKVGESAFNKLRDRLYQINAFF